MDYNNMAQRLAALGGMTGPGLGRRQDALRMGFANQGQPAPGGLPTGVSMQDIAVPQGWSRSPQPQGQMPQQMQAAMGRPAMYNPVVPMGMPAGVPANAAAFGRKF